MRGKWLFPTGSWHPLAGFVAPARHSAALWLIPLAAVMAGVVYLLWMSAMMLAIALSQGLGLRVVAPFSDLAAPTGMLGMLTTFGGAALGCALAVRILHGRAARTLIAPDWVPGQSLDQSLGQSLGRRPMGRDGWRTALAVTLVHLLPLALVAAAGHLTSSRSLVSWLGLLPFALPALLIQTLAEEMIFRGYLLQQLAARFRSAFVWMVLPAIAFGALHLPNGPGSGMLSIWAFAFGLVAADLTARTGTLAAAWAFHAANNGSAMLLAGPEQMSGLTLWTIGESGGGSGGGEPGMTVGALVAALVILLISWLAARIALRV